MSNVRQYFLEQFQPLGIEFRKKKVEPVTFASGRPRFLTMPVATASPLIAMTMGILVVALFRSLGSGRSVRHQNVDFATDQICH